MGRLFLTLIEDRTTIEEASNKSGLSVEDIAALISNPGADSFFENSTIVPIFIDVRQSVFL